MSFEFDLTAPFQPEFTTKDQVANRHKIRPILVPSANGDRFRLNENGLRSVLGHSAIQNRKVVIISVAGAFRKGKSFLLNFFLEYLYALQKSQQNETPLDWLGDDAQVHGFHWRSGAKRDTVGIWMWGEPIMIESPSGENLAVVLLDTQGAFDNQSTYQQCTTIFALSTIVSSLQIYNVVDAIQEDALQNLSLFVEYGRLATQHARQFGTPFQSLCFCVRDFKAPEEFAFGEEGGSQYMDHTPPGQAAELRATRDQLAACFDRLFCYLLPHPGHRVAERNSFKGHIKDLRPVFREEMRKMVVSLLSPEALRPKIVNGKPATCKRMMQYFKEYAATFDSSSMPQPMNLLQANARLLNYEATQDAKNVYCRLMDRATSGHSMLPTKKLLEDHIRCGIAAVNAYDRHPKIIAEAGDQKENHEKLQELINSELERYKRVNAAKKVPGCVHTLTACGDSVLLGIGLGTAASSAVAATVVTLNTGLVSLGIVAIPISLVTLTAIWVYVYGKPIVTRCFTSRNREAALLDSDRKDTDRS
ncbi:hypothetical protein PFISCL1PPCAC_17033 [Pristionchus fissidentatus]|uniref:GB1/RHD3-type G domain-containing protein n=1 Tax=Pristionchus fissidentatus TaxID=1538716 RepID=A0AAV5W1P1_9BILA|nr:hypothetical protein PFISCL1PPCAC_17033 [Pristionchus fissidentatus]